jgi:hypothetical protein
VKRRVSRMLSAPEGATGIEEEEEEEEEEGEGENI